MNRNTTQRKQPSHGIFHVTGDGDNARFRRVGSGYAHQDNDGMGLFLHYVPTGTTGRLVVRKLKPKDAAKANSNDGEE